MKRLETSSSIHRRAWFAAVTVLASVIANVRRWPENWPSIVMKETR